MTSPASWNPYLRAPLVRDDTGEQVGSTWGGTVCWWPRKPSQFAAISEHSQDEVILRCGWCPGCKEFDRQRLARRLIALYGKTQEHLWQIEIECTLKLQSALVARIRRTGTLPANSGFYRLGPTGVALIVRGNPTAIVARLTRLGVFYRLLPMSSPKRARTWRRITRGMLAARDAWGEQINRYYHRGLPPAERERWTIQTRGGIAKRHAGQRRHARATRAGVTLYRPDEIAVVKLVRRCGPELARSSKPELVSALISDAYDRLVAPTMLCRPSIIAPPAQPALAAAAIGADTGGADLCSGSPRDDRRSTRGLQKFSTLADDELTAWVKRMREISRRRTRAGP
jgi:hypothetical protein